MLYHRPIVMTNPARSEGALRLAGGWGWFDRVEERARGAAARLVPAGALTGAERMALTAPRADFCGLSMDRPRIMGILNITPDSFSDGGRFLDADKAMAQGRALIEAGADILDIGGESTRPGARAVPEAEEIARTVPVIRALRAGGLRAPISIDTRKAAVARAALDAGADMVNDVSALAYDPAMADLIGARGVPVCLMHAQGAPETMQDDPRYGDVVADIYDALAAIRDRALARGIAQGRILLDPGIGFGKTIGHNLALMRALSVFHGLGCALLLGASRKSFIGAVGGTTRGESRLPGSLAAALAGVAQGVQIVRVHDVAETRQALRLWQAMAGEEVSE
jgi:dihydropteroate synthase